MGGRGDRVRPSRADAWRKDHWEAIEWRLIDKEPDHSGLASAVQD